MPDSGLFENTLGAELTACIDVDIGIISQEFEIGIWEITEDANTMFTPYLLPGAPDRPVSVAETLGPFTLVDMASFDLGLVSGWITIDYQFDVPGISYQGTRIETDELEAQGGTDVASHDQEGQIVSAILPNAMGGEPASVWATKYGEFNSEVALRLMPTVHLDQGGGITIGPFDIPVDYDVIEDEEIVFPELQLTYNVPEMPAGSSGGADDESTGDGNDDSGAEQGGTTSGGETTTSGGSNDESGGISGGPPGEFDGADTGCGCRGGDPPWAIGLVILLAAARRRRRSLSH